ncbi:RlpA-like double-psi beta-barrel-protein domain-containing protein-containing protein [Dichomitus squalens]|uniref:RlpA-like double-psi beta-barrel-protein domain-containing protein-containing protein n=1 Tax=Dichomitus squalens TaxID=114155 RepID=A0A4Q9QFX2_9APHY|nr:RlpA-like double-psi beta-barrel-protein domain-containing protein-containing protein [Dichomitus squalens]
MHFFTLASVALTAVAGASAIVIPHRHAHVARQTPPSTYAEGYLEDYKVYHARYMALDCEAQHNTTFFDKCCHPLLATETLAKNRAPECNPANHVSSTASSAAPTQSQVLSSGGNDGDDGDDCDDDEPTSTVSSAAPTSTDDEGDDCDDDEPTSTVTPSSSHVATSTAHSSTIHSSSAHSVTLSSTHVATTSSHSSSTPVTTHATTKASSTKTSAAAPTSTGSSSGDFTGGHATFFYQGGNAGACGQVHPDSAFIAALQTKRYGDLSQESSNCGRKITATNTNNGKSVTVTVADACPTCPEENDLDLSFAAFTSIATEEEGEVPIVWHFD